MKPDYLYDPHAMKAAEEHCRAANPYRWQPEKDGTTRPGPETEPDSEEAFADRIEVACCHAQQLDQLLSMRDRLSAIGAEMEPQEEISVMAGESNANRALAHLMRNTSRDTVTRHDAVRSRPARFVFRRTAAGGHRLSGRTGFTADGPRSG